MMPTKWSFFSLKKNQTAVYIIFNVIIEIEDPILQDNGIDVSKSLRFIMVGQFDVSESDSRGKPKRGAALKVFIALLGVAFEGVRSSHCVVALPKTVTAGFK